MFINIGQSTHIAKKVKQTLQTLKQEEMCLYGDRRGGKSKQGSDEKMNTLYVSSLLQSFMQKWKLHISLTKKNISMLISDWYS